MRCSCGVWLAIPIGEQLAIAAANDVIKTDPSDLPISFDAKHARLTAQGLIELPSEPGDVIYQEIPVNAKLAPGSMLRTSASNQTRWTTRTLLEFTLLMIALLGPQVAAWLLARGNEFALLLPAASLVSGVLVASVVAWAGPYGRVGLRFAAPRFFVEAVAATALAVLLASGYVLLLRELLPDAGDGLDELTSHLGLPMSLLVMAVSPALLEEVIFRGMLQGRLMALYGRNLGLFVTATAFALVHGQPAVLPIHLSLGLYLGWLRERSNSLLPGMLMHFIYNGTLVAMPFVLAD